MENIKIRNYLSLHIALLLLSFSGVFSKYAAQEIFLSWRFILLYGGAIFMLLFYSFVWQQTIKFVSLSTAYFNKAVTVIWGMLWGTIFFDEDINLQKIIAAVIIVSGVILYSLPEKSARRD